MRHIFVLAVGIGLTVSAHAMAQTTSSDSASQSGAQSGAAAQSGLTIINGTGKSTQTVDYKGSYNVNNVPDQFPPNLVAGLNACVGSTSLGVGVAGFGISGGTTVVDEGCNLRNFAALVNQMGDPPAAREILCGDDDVRAAFARVGRPCLADTKAPDQRVAAAVVPSRPVAEARLPVMMAPIVSRGDPGYHR